jgi:predicted small lipoprotein YifL
MKKILLAGLGAAALLLTGCGDAGDVTTPPVNVTTPPVEVTTPPVEVTTPPVYVTNDYNITIIVPAAEEDPDTDPVDVIYSGGPEVSGGNPPSTTVVKPCASANGCPGTTAVINPCASANGCPTGCNAQNLDACGLPVNYVGTGASYDPYVLFNNGEVNVKEGTWTYYKIQNNFNSNCTYRIILPVQVTSTYIYDDNNIEQPRTYVKGAYIVDSNKSLYMDLYSLSAGFIEVYTDCWVETR